VDELPVVTAHVSQHSSDGSRSATLTSDHLSYIGLIHSEFKNERFVTFDRAHLDGIRMINKGLGNVLYNLFVQGLLPLIS